MLDSIELKIEAREEQPSVGKHCAIKNKLGALFSRPTKEEVTLIGRKNTLAP